MSLGRQKLSEFFYEIGRKDVIQRLEELNELQWMRREQILEVQREELRRMLLYAKEFVPYYRDLFRRISFEPDDILNTPDAFLEIPLLTKSLIRENREQLMTTDPTKKKALHQVKTGGTTGEPLSFVRDANFRDYNIAHDYHVMTWSGWQLGEPQFWLWGHVPDNQAKINLLSPVTKVKDWLISRFDSDAFVMSTESMGELADKLEANPGGILWSYVSTAYRFCQFLQQRGHHIQLKAVYTAAEPLFEHQRQFMQAVLGCPVFNNYSSIDTGDIASECEEHNGLHILSRNCYVEVVRDGIPVPDGEAGEFVLTTLTNYGMPLIRYKIEDWGKKSTRSCPCGRGLPMLEVVEGRKIDLFKTRDGRIVYGAFAKDLIPTLGDVRQFQIVQKSLDLVVFRIVHKGTLDQQRMQKIESVSKAALGDNVKVEFEFVDQLPSTPTGKHRYLVSEVE